MKNQFIVLPIVSLLFFACSGDSEQMNVNDKPGQLYYYSKFSPLEKMYIYDGEDILISIGLEQKFETKDTITTGGGKELCLTLKKSDNLTEGTVLEFPSSDIEAVVNVWALPSTFDLRRDIKGKITIKEYKPYEYLKFDVELEMKEGFDKLRKLKRKDAIAECSVHHRYYPYTLPEQEAYDDSYPKDELSPQLFEGKWRRKKQLFFDKHNNQWRSFFYFKEDLIWELKDGNFVAGGQSEPISIEGTRFMFRDYESGNKMFFAINSFDGKTWTLSNLNDVRKTRYILEKVQE